MRQSRINDAMNQLNTRYEGQTQSNNYNSQAGLLTYEGSQAQTAGYLGAGSALLGGAADYGLMRYGKSGSIGP